MMNQLFEVSYKFAILSLLIGILMYFIFKIFQLNAFRRYSEIYILEAALTIFLILAFSIFVPRLDGFLSKLAVDLLNANGISVNSNSPNLYYIVMEMLRYRYENCYIRLYANNILAKAVFSSLGSLLGHRHAEGVTLPNPSVAFLTTNIDFLLDLYYFLSISTLFIMKLLKLFGAYGPFLMALGLLLRAFEPLRSLGAYLFAVGFGFYFVFGLGYIIGYVSLSYDKSMCGTLKEIDANEDYKRAVGTYTYGLFGNLGQSFQLLITYVDVLASSFLAPERAAKIISSIFLTHFVNPIVTFVITLSFINITTTALGGRISEIGRGFFKLV